MTFIPPLRRRLTVVASLAVVGMLSACTPAPSDNAANGEISGEITFVYGAFAPQEKWEGYFDAFLEEHPDVTINYVPVSLDAGWGDYAQKIATLIAGGEKPDVIWLATEGVAALADKGVLLPLDDLIAQDADDADLQDFLADVAPSLMDATAYNGDQYLLPFAYNSILTWYNPVLFEAAGVEPPAPGWSMDDYLDKAQALTQDTDGDGTPNIWGTFAEAGWFGTSAMAIANGGNLLSDDGQTAQIDSEPVREAIQFTYDLVYKYKVAPQPTGLISAEMLSGGTLATLPAGRWLISGFLASGFEDYAVTNFPGEGTVVGSDGYGVTTVSENPDAAWALTKYLVSVEVEETLMDGQVSGSIPSRKSVATNPEMGPPENYEIFYESLDNAQPVPAGVLYPELVAVWDRYMSLLMANETTVDDAIENMQSEMTAILER